MVQFCGLTVAKPVLTLGMKEELRKRERLPGKEAVNAQEEDDEELNGEVRCRASAARANYRLRQNTFPFVLPVSFLLASTRTSLSRGFFFFSKNKILEYVRPVGQKRKVTGKGLS